MDIGGWGLKTMPSYFSWNMLERASSKDMKLLAYVFTCHCLENSWFRFLEIIVPSYGSLLSYFNLPFKSFLNKTKESLNIYENVDSFASKRGWINLIVLRGLLFVTIHIISNTYVSLHVKRMKLENSTAHSFPESALVSRKKYRVTTDPQPSLNRSLV